MKSIHLQQTVKKDGEIHVNGLPFKKGERIELIVQSESSAKKKKPYATVKQLLNSDLVGLWKDRKDIKDSAVFARKLREKAQNRGIVTFDSDDDI